MADRPFMTPRRALAAILIFQVGLAAFLFAGDLQGGFSLSPGRPEAPEFRQPVRPGDQRRTYEPRPTRERPSRDGVPVSEPMPERLVLTQPDGTWQLEGMIAPGDAERIIGQLSEGEAPERLVLNSSGGSVQDALALGRHLRRAGVAIDMGAEDVCLSACPYLLAGGTERVVDAEARVGLHQHYFGESTILPAFVAVESIQRGQGEVMIYLDEMGVDPLMMQHALGTPPDEIYLLVAEELTRYGLATEVAGD